MEVDIALVLLLAAGFLLGIARGAVRQLIVIGAWFVAFIISASLRPLGGDWIAANAPEYTREHVEMLAFVGTFLVLFTLAVVIIEIRGKTIQLTERVALDQVLGGFLALGATLLAAASVVVAIDSYYAAGLPVGGSELGLARDLHLAFERSSIVGAMRDSLIAGLVAVLGPLLPADVRLVYA